MENNLAIGIEITNYIHFEPNNLFSRNLKEIIKQIYKNVAEEDIAHSCLSQPAKPGQEAQ